MEHIVSILSDPAVRSLLSPLVGESTRWGLSAIRARYAGTPDSIRLRAERNAESFAESIAEKVAQRISNDAAAKAVISEEVHSPKGIIALQRALEASAEIDDDFTRDTLADLVSRRLSVRGATRLQIATKLACDVVADLTEEHLRLLAFLAFTQNLKPLAVVDNVDQWTDRVIKFLVVNFPRLKVAADPRDLNLIVSAGLATLFPGVVAIDLKATYVNAEGFIPNIDPFLANDDLGKELKAAYTPTQYVRLNLVGQMLGITTFDKIVGQGTDLSGV